jgi:glycosyltransferase involved in cell wall biosynthesis
MRAVEDAIAAARDRFGRVAIAHEWLTIPGGSELVVEAMLEVFPDAEIFTSVHDPAAFGPPIAGRPVHASFLNRVPRATRIYPRLLPLMDGAFRSFDLRGFDLVLSSNHACAKNVRTPAGALHVCYCHTPMRYAWDPQFLAGEELGPAARLAARALLPMLRRRDRAAAAGPDRFLANSTAVAERIRRFYAREAVVLPPPVDVEPLLRTPRGSGGYYLFLSRIVPYKRADLAVEACTTLGRPLKVAGEGRALAKLRARAGSNVEFLGLVPAADLPGLLAGARALLFPGEEDFGIVPVEAQAAGTPVIAYGRGGARDTVVDGVTGVLFEPQTAAALAAAIVAFEQRTWSEEAVRGNARRFGRERFLDGLARQVLEASGDAPPGRYSG